MIAPSTTNIDGFGTRSVAVDAEAGDQVEILELAPFLVEHEDFVETLAERVARFASMRHTSYAHLRRLDRLDGQRLQLVSDLTPGWRLSDLFAESADAGTPVDINVFIGLMRQLLPAVALYARHNRDAAIGTLAPERLILTPQARLVVAEHAFGPPLEKLNLGRDRLWRDFRVTMAPSAGLPRANQRADAMGIGAVGLSLLIGRVIAQDEFPSALASLVAGAQENRGGQATPLSPALSSWLKRALQIEADKEFQSPSEAQLAFETVLISERSYVMTPGVLENWVTTLGARIDARKPAPEPEPVAEPEPAPSEPQILAVEAVVEEVDLLEEPVQEASEVQEEEVDLLAEEPAVQDEPTVQGEPTVQQPEVQQAEVQQAEVQDAPVEIYSASQQYEQPLESRAEVAPQEEVPQPAEPPAQQEESPQHDEEAALHDEETAPPYEEPAAQYEEPAPPPASKPAEPIFPDPVFEPEPEPEPVLAEPAVAESVVPEPPAPEPVVDEPAYSEPPVLEPVVPEPVAVEPVVPEPAVPEPAVPEPVVAVPVPVEDPIAAAIATYKPKAAPAPEPPLPPPPPPAPEPQYEAPPPAPVLEEAGPPYEEPALTYSPASVLYEATAVTSTPEPATEPVREPETDRLDQAEPPTPPAYVAPPAEYTPPTPPAPSGYEPYQQPGQYEQPVQYEQPAVETAPAEAPRPETAPAPVYASSDEPRPDAPARSRTPMLVMAAVIVVLLIAVGYFATRGGSGGGTTGNGEVAITTRNPGATVKIDGRDSGVTPLTVSLPPGPHVVEVQMGNGEPRVVPVMIKSGIQTAQYVELPEPVQPQKLPPEKTRKR